MKLLLVDDESGIRAALGRGLAADGFGVDAVGDGIAALELADARHYDAIVLDIMLPGVSGYEVLKELRGRGDWTPVLMLSAKDGEYDLADALDLGADDYLTKPFSYVVLLARLRALARRSSRTRPPILQWEMVRLDPARRSVTVRGEPVDLTAREYRLLENLMGRAGAAVSKIDLLEQVFDANPDSKANLVEVYVGYLRRKIGSEVIATVPGGYRMSRP